MTYDIVKQAIEELQDVVRCTAYTECGLHDPGCECDSKDAVKIVADRIATLEELLETAVRDAKEAEAYVAELEKRRVAILQEREAYDEQREQEAELQDLRDEVDTLTASLDEVTAVLNTMRLSRNHWATQFEAAEAMLPAAYRAGVEACARQCKLLDSGWEDETGLIVYASAGYCAISIRALPTPTSAELIERLKETE